ncbi:MAG: single-stranded-DNA-specific exonuclease RecJ, partial [Pseudomonadota bacterium]|nr:single-stranded-DNA-specific exonuclease RecJ [Pseudomonadota bacterium]
ALQAAAVAAGVVALGSSRVLASDGDLVADYFDAATARLLDSQVWGSAFAAPVFSETVVVESQRLVGDKHLKLVLRVGARSRDAIWFGRREPVADRLHLAYRIAVDAYNGNERAQMIVVHAEPA